MKFKKWMLTVLYRLSLQLMCCCLSFCQKASADFEPFQLNGGLIAAVAGRDYVVIASDTRLMAGYEILTRAHTSSRLWSPIIQQGTNSVTHSDGSIRLSAARSSFNDDKEDCDQAANDLSTSLRKSRSTFTSRQPPVWIASSGCSSDCEQLKRIVRSSSRSIAYHCGDMRLPSAVLLPSSLAVLLSHTLYGRRGFPFYSFCILAGLSPTGSSVYVYDAIGSYEQVSVAATGTGHKLLQPILDRQFNRMRLHNESTTLTHGLDLDEEYSNANLGFVRISTHLAHRGIQVQRSYPTSVHNTLKETVQILRSAYESVSEREIAVGDQLVLCVMQRKKNDRYECSVSSYPLKKH